MANKGGFRGFASPVRVMASSKNKTEVLHTYMFHTKIPNKKGWGMPPIVHINRTHRTDDKIHVQQAVGDASSHTEKFRQCYSLDHPNTRLLDWPA